MSNTLRELLASQDELVREAALALPHSFSQCTYNLGYIRQAVYLCLTCATPRGICYPCSVACHTNHEQVELFPKRRFRCDCPTGALSHPCGLHKAPEEANAENAYGQNFEGRFCRCGRAYDAHAEVETMIQCLACEDWYHESCLNLRKRPTTQDTDHPPTPHPHPHNQPGEHPPHTTNEQTSTAEEGSDGGASEASSSGLPPPLITADQYEALVCRSCVLEIPILRKYAGTPDALVVIRRSSEGVWTVLGGASDLDADFHIDVEAGAKRSRNVSEDGEPALKRVRLHGGDEQSGTSASALPCLAPSPSQEVQSLLQQVEKGDYEFFAGDLFLTDDFRDRWCKCTSCSESLSAHPYLLTEEDTYEPPADPDSGLSLEELGLRALEHIPRDRAIDGIQAFMDLRDGLMQYLKPFAEQDKEVNESDIQAFFEARKQGKS
ncbi:hypothetical protein BJ322DRAFT_1106424 [Thelephora terrestris]|uniref:UBR-type domain-containing protein n=1 Tax=Thelephora terrestris TaxID=56493 RepID=A0A9P6HMG3_9AGAM|nr:hypothetical protein BJ322DRAFT_1106424 [Thelephora terrestris]